MIQAQKREKILVAMSGGMGSFVTAALLKSEGYDVLGVHFQIGPSEVQAKCCSSLEPAEVQKIASKIEVPCSVIDLRDRFMHEVVDYYLHDYLQYRKPAPCVQCDVRMKLVVLEQHADQLKIPLIATGHYAQVTRDAASGLARLRKAVDAAQDQSQQLFGVSQKLLARMVMPLGSLSHAMTMKLAQQFGYPMTEQKAELPPCLSGAKTAAFLEKRVPAHFRMKGMIRTSEGKVVGEHFGLFQYAIGDKSGTHFAVEDAKDMYVVGFDSNSQSLIVGPEAKLNQRQLVANQGNWIRPMDSLRGVRCGARVGIGGTEVPCRVTCFENHVVHVEFDTPQRAVMAGQPVIFYEGDEILGGAYIERVGPLA